MRARCRGPPRPPSVQTATGPARGPSVCSDVCLRAACSSCVCEVLDRTPVSFQKGGALLRGGPAWPGLSVPGCELGRAAGGEAGLSAPGAAGEAGADGAAQEVSFGALRPLPGPAPGPAGPLGRLPGTVPAPPPRLPAFSLHVPLTPPSSSIRPPLLPVTWLADNSKGCWLKVTSHQSCPLSALPCGPPTLPALWASGGLQARMDLTLSGWVWPVAAPARVGEEGRQEGALYAPPPPVSAPGPAGSLPGACTTLLARFRQPLPPTHHPGAWGGCSPAASCAAWGPLPLCGGRPTVNKPPQGLAPCCPERRGPPSSARGACEARVRPLGGRTGSKRLS